MEGGQLGGDEWTRHGSFVNKPTRGWLHSDGVVSTTGVSYTVRVSELCSFSHYKCPYFRIIGSQICLHCCVFVGMLLTFFRKKMK